MWFVIYRLLKKIEADNARMQEEFEKEKAIARAKEEAVRIYQHICLENTCKIRTKNTKQQQQQAKQRVKERKIS